MKINKILVNMEFFSAAKISDKSFFYLWLMAPNQIRQTVSAEVSAGPMGKTAFHHGGDRMAVKIFDKVRTKSVETGCVAAIHNDGEAYEFDLELHREEQGAGAGIKKGPVGTGLF